MFADALGSPYLCTDATGVLGPGQGEVPTRSLLGAHRARAARPLRVLQARQGGRRRSAARLQGLPRRRRAHRLRSPLQRREVIEVACWAHAGGISSRRSRQSRSGRKALALIGALFRVERTVADAPRRRERRRAGAKSGRSSKDSSNGAIPRHRSSSTRRRSPPASATRSTSASPCSASSTTGACPSTTTSPSELVEPPSRRASELAFRRQRRRRRDQHALRLAPRERQLHDIEPSATSAILLPASELAPKPRPRARSRHTGSRPSSRAKLSRSWPPTSSAASCSTFRRERSRPIAAPSYATAACPSGTGVTERIRACRRSAADRDATRVDHQRAPPGHHPFARGVGRGKHAPPPAPGRTEMLDKLCPSG